MPRQFFPLVVVALAWPFYAAATPVEEKADSTTKLVSITTQLGDIARRQTTNYPKGAIGQQIDRLVEQVTSSEDLVRLALICQGILGTGHAEHASYDGVFDYAMWHCATLLSRRPGRDGEESLAYLLPVIGRDGGASLTMRELIEAQKKLPSSNQ